MNAVTKIQHLLVSQKDRSFTILGWDQPRWLMLPLGNPWNPVWTHGQNAYHQPQLRRSIGSRKWENDSMTKVDPLESKDCKGLFLRNGSSSKSAIVLEVKYKTFWWIPWKNVPKNVDFFVTPGTHGTKHLILEGRKHLWTSNIFQGFLFRSPWRKGNLRQT